MKFDLQRLYRPYMSTHRVVKSSIWNTVMRIATNESVDQIKRNVKRRCLDFEEGYRK